jgi:ABC-2 type transport system permease protein
MFLSHLSNELWKLFGKPRTYIGFAMFLVAQNIILAVFRFSPALRGMTRTLEGNGYAPELYLSSLTIAVVVALPIAYLLLPLYVTLIGGDLVAKEGEDGTLRMILARPVSRLQLLLAKWVAGALFTALLALFLALSGLAFASIWFPWGRLFVFIPGELFGVFPPLQGLARYLAAHGLLAITSCTLMGLAFLFSCFSIKPAAATILALSVLFVNSILMNIPQFSELRPWFLTHHLNVWQSLLAQPIPWFRLVESMSILLGFNVTFFSIGAAVFTCRDIKS